jgi:hypothetical protein
MEPPTRKEMNEVARNINRAVQRLKNEYPPDSRLISTLRGLVTSGICYASFRIISLLPPLLTHLKALQSVWQLLRLNS